MSNYSEMEGKRKKKNIKRLIKKTTEPESREASSRLGGLQSCMRVCCAEQPEVYRSSVVGTLKKMKG